MRFEQDRYKAIADAGAGLFWIRLALPLFYIVGRRMESRKSPISTILRETSVLRIAVLRASLAGCSMALRFLYRRP